MKNFKALIFIIVILLPVFIFSACKGQKKDENTDKKIISGNFEWQSTNNSSYTKKLYFKDKKFSMYDVEAGNPMLGGTYTIDEKNKTITMKCDPVDFHAPEEWKDFKAEDSTVSYELSENNKVLILSYNGVPLEFKKD